MREEASEKRAHTKTTGKAQLPDTTHDRKKESKKSNKKKMSHKNATKASNRQIFRLFSFFCRVLCTFFANILQNVKSYIHSEAQKASKDLLAVP